jgi:hypothetical protein
MAPDQTPEPTYRWRRRKVQRVRVTWLGMVLVLCLMVHRSLLRAHPEWSTTVQTLTFLPTVVLPMLLLTLWRLGLLPPERVLVAPNEAGDPRVRRHEPDA